MSNHLELKKTLFEACSLFIENRLIRIQKTINEIQESLQSETKNTAGDKHETGRAMLQLEREKAGNQLLEIQKIKEALYKIDISKTANKVSLGSVVFTSNDNYFIAISTGLLSADNTSFYAISSHTPIGQLLMGKTVGDEVVFRGNKFKIKSIF